MPEIHILLVDDNEGDILLTREALEEAKIVNRISVAYDGIEAIRFLKKDPPISRGDTPDLILLDINVPKLDGKEVLRIIKSDPALKRILLIILTTSSYAQDSLPSYDNLVHCYITKQLY